MKLSKISMMTIAAIYAGSAAASASEQSPRPLVITEQIKKFNEQKNKDRLTGQVIQPSRTSNGTNVHRAIQMPGNDKVPFKYERDVTGEQTYIVRLKDKPVSLYQGGVHNLDGTSARLNQVPASLSLYQHDKLNLDSSTVRDYRSYLTVKQDEALSNMHSVAGETRLLSRYQLAFNGMSLRMTQEQAARIAELPEVMSVTREKMYQLHTDVGPKHIGADKLWTGMTSSERFQGEGIIVGVLDTGVNSDHPAFAATDAEGYTHTNPWGAGKYVGDCENADFAHMCNDKLIGVRSYPVITDSYAAIEYFPDLGWWETPTPIRSANGEDYNGHGSHTASTAAGNVLLDVDYVVPDITEQGDGIKTGLKFDRISGVAPRANVVMYQVCFPGDGTLTDKYYGCPGSALLAGVEDAIADGVDVINYSIGAPYGDFPWEDPMEMAFLSARESGISVSASAGNSFEPRFASQARGAIDHLSPWVTSVAATTHGREIVVEGKMITANGLNDIQGKGITGAYTGPVVEAAAYGAEYTKCNEPFPAGFFTNDPDGNPFATAPIVVCARGDIARVSKAQNVADGGAGGFILYDVNRNDSQFNDPYVIPGIHISYGAWNGDWTNNYSGLKQWLASAADPQLTITAAEVKTRQGTADYVGDFSSRGPNLDNPEVMSPNLAAPGVNVFAAWADDMPFTAIPGAADYAAISGTSMAAPHVAGAMALLKQSHRDWTPAQIQSALMTTANLDGVTRARDSNPYDPVKAGFSDAGSGVINIARADKAGLVMDETGDNYRAANPKNGGTVNTLNVPYFFHESCAGTCSLMRVVTATRDGSWTLDTLVDDIEGAEMLELEVTPKQFSLRKGESQAIMLTAKVLEIQAPGADSSSLQLTGDVIITPQDSDMPLQHLPVGMRFGNDTLPQQVSAPIHRSKGHVLSMPVRTAEIQSFNSVVYGLSKGERIDWQMKRSTVRETDNATRAEREADGQFVRFFDVPEGTKRLVFEFTEVDANAYASMDLGMDVNGDEEIQWSDEALCYSRVDHDDYCAINDPAPGRYWVYASNLKDEYEDPDNLTDNFQMILALVGGEDAGNLSIEGPASTDGLEPYNLKLNYDLDAAEEGDVFYGYAGIGSDAYNADNLGSFAVKLTHRGSDTKVTASQTQAKAGDIIDVTVELAPNHQGGDRPFTINTELATGLKLLEDSIRIGGLGDYAEGLSVDGQVLTINATQASSADIKPHYVFTTNETDATCKVPYGDNPSYFDLSAQMAPLGMAGYANEYLSIPLSENGLPKVPLYGIQPEDAQDVLEISPFGHVKFDSMPLFWNMIRPFDESYQDFPDTMIAPLWRGDVILPETTFDWATGSYLHDVWAVVTNKHYLFQWKGGKEEYSFFSGNMDPDPDAYFDIETIIATKLDFAPGTPEIIFAYNTIQTHNDDMGAIGIHGYAGERGTWGPINGWYNDGFAYNDVDTKVKDGTVVCADYRGPEQTGLLMTFQVRVSANAVGKANPIVVTSQYDDSEVVTVTHNLLAPSNITLAEIADREMDENTTLEGIEVFYQDVKGTANGIKVTGDNISATINGDVSGSSFSITPDKNWFGTTEVTVTVFDKAYPDDSASTSFTLNVISDGKGPSGVAPAAPAEPEPEQSSGGSLGFISLLLLGLFGASRRKIS